MAADDYMDDESSPSTAQSSPADEPSQKDEENEEQLALVPNSFFKKEPKPGMREKVEVVQVYEDECSIKCIYEDEDEEEGEEDEYAESEAEPEDEMMT